MPELKFGPTGPVSATAARGSAGDSASGCSRWRNSRFMKPGAVARGFQPSRSTVRRMGAPELERLVAAPHVDVEFRTLDLGPCIEDRVDAVVARIRESISTTDPSGRSADRGGDAGLNGEPAAVVRPLQYAVAVNDSLVPGSGGGMTDVALAVPPVRLLRVEHGRLVEANEADRRDCRHDHLPPERASDDHRRSRNCKTRPEIARSFGFSDLQISPAACGG